MSEIKEFGIVCHWHRPETTTYRLYATNIEQASEIARLTFAKTHTDICVLERVTGNEIDADEIDF